MPDKQEIQQNSCAYCLKPVADNFICEDCMKSKNVSLEKLGVPSEELINQNAAKKISQSPQRAEPVTALERSRAKDRNQPWKKFQLHPDFAKLGSRAKLLTAAGLLPVAIVGFGVSTMFGFPEVLASCIAVALAVGWIVYRSEQASWFHYASWVFRNGQKLECEIDLVSSGELDKPYVVLKDENRITLVYETRVFKLVSGDTEKLLQDLYAPGTKTAYIATAYFDKELGENAVVFEIASSLLWCKAHLSRGI